MSETNFVKRKPTKTRFLPRETHAPVTVEVEQEAEKFSIRRSVFPSVDEVQLARSKYIPVMVGDHQSRPNANTNE